IRLAERFGEGGGAFTFLSRLGHRSLAGSLSWPLIVGYVLTTAVYAFTFGHYLSNVIGGCGLLAVGIMATLAAVNVRGAGSATRHTGRANFTAAAWSWHHFLDISVYPDRLVVRAVNQDVRVFDEVEIAAGPT
ncbi:MAG TPA: hypothetical protein VM262_14045, partial [Acidimicrobiales bacterium]|nr:hypothetical protein [Acidimicrobiales bacterium]